MRQGGSGRGGPVLAIDIGGTKIAAALVDPDGVVTERRQQATREDPEAALLAVLAGLPHEGITGIGVSCGGPMIWPEGFITPPNTPVWRDGYALGDVLRERYAPCEVRIHNDVVALVVGEHWKGAAQGVDEVLGMVVSTGVGGGIITGGRVMDGRSGNAGHIGHVVVEPDGPPCGCGGHGCLEAVARGPAVVARAVARGSAAKDGLELARHAVDGEPVAISELARAGRALGTGIASAAALLDLELVVLGGGFSQAGPALWDPMRQAMAEHARLGFLAGLQVVPTELGQDSGLVGAAAFFHAADHYWVH